jgi:RHS repeat-associated protein
MVSLVLFWQTRNGRNKKETTDDAPAHRGLRTSTPSASFTYTGAKLVLSAARETEKVSFTTEVASGVDNSFEFNVTALSGAGEEGVLVTVVEKIDNIDYVIGGGRIGSGAKQKVNFRSSINNVSVWFTGPYATLELAQVCTQHPVSVQHTYLVDVCDESKDRYAFGFNGMLKDNELKGIGNSLDFGARIYDSRGARFLSLDPLARQFSSESNYSFAGNSPLIFIDKDGEKKTTYYYTIDMRSGKVTVPVSGDVTKGLYRQHYRDGNGRDRWKYYDYSEINITVIQADGSKRIIKTTPFNLDEKASLMLPFDWGAEVLAGEKEFPNWTAARKEGKAGKTYGGINWTTKNMRYGGDSWFNKKGRSDAPSINIDDFLDAATAAAAAANGGALGPEDLQGLMRLASDAAQTTNAVYENAVGPNFNEIKEISDDKPIKVCATCKAVKQDGTPISTDSANKVITPQNTDTQTTSEFHK